MEPKGGLGPVVVNGDFGHWFANVREDRGYTQEELAHAAHTAQSAISRLENNHVSPTLTTVQSLLNAMGLNLMIGAKEVTKNEAPRHYDRIRIPDRSHASERG